MRIVLKLLPVLILAVLPSCDRPAPTTDLPRPPIVIVGSPRYDDVVDYEEFTGRTEAVRVVELRSRISGYLMETHFVEGSQVELNQLLFTIDDRLFQAEFSRATANLKLAEVRVERQKRDLERAKRLRGTAAISEEEFDRFASDFAEGEASVGVAAALLKTAEENLKYTKISAPTAGVIGRRFIDPGSLVQADATPLTTLLVVDPLFVNFDIDDRTLLALRRVVDAGEVTLGPDRKTSIDIGLPDEEGFSLTGKVNFIDNKLDPGTGTIRLRADVANTKRLLTPGLFVRVRLPIGAKTKQLLVPKAAVSTDQGQKVIYAVNDANKVVRRRIAKVGKTYGQEVVLLQSEVQSSDRIIVEGQQRARPGVEVNPQTPKPPAPKASP